MSDSDRIAALGNLQIAVTAFERQLGALEEVPSAGLEEMKGAVDDVRMRIWSVLMASNSKDYRGFRDRYRLRRAAETLRGLATDVDARHAVPGAPGGDGFGGGHSGGGETVEEGAEGDLKQVGEVGEVLEVGEDGGGWWRLVEVGGGWWRLVKDGHLNRDRYSCQVRNRDRFCRSSRTAQSASLKKPASRANLSA